MLRSYLPRIATFAGAVAFAAATVMLAAAPTPAKAELEKVIIRVSVDLPPPPHPTAIAMEWFKEQVESQFPEGSEVRNFYAGALYKDPDAMTAMTQGNLEMGWLVSGKTAATDIWMSIIGQPGVLTTVAAIHDLPNQATGKMLLNRLREKHFIEPFGFVDLSFALAIAGKERLLAMDSFQGKKIRTFAAAVNPVVASWGASPVVMSFGDVPSALESGVLDGVITSIGGWRAITEQTPYYTIAGISTVTFDNYWVGASQAWFNKLNDATQAKIRELVRAGREVPERAQLVQRPVRHKPVQGREPFGCRHLLRDSRRGEAAAGRHRQQCRRLPQGAAAGGSP